MKKAILILALAFVAHLAQAQKIPMDSYGYWVIESTKQTPKNSVVKFYNLKQELVYQDSVKGKKLNANNNRTRKALNHTLQMALAIKNTQQPVLAMELAK